jgi:hypothetical protein
MISNPLIPSFYPLLIVVVYLLALAICAGILYLLIRLAVLHALRAHQRWLESRPPHDAGQ